LQSNHRTLNHQESLRIGEGSLLTLVKNGIEALSLDPYIVRVNKPLAFVLTRRIGSDIMR
jgi:hypothetical protein